MHFSFTGIPFELLTLELLACPKLLICVFVIKVYLLYFGHNTPWGETCCYVLTDNLTDFESNMKRFQPQKKMHVSPFMPMDVDYDWLFSDPCDSLKVMMGNSKDKEKFFNVSMSLNRKKITSYKNYS